MAGALAPPGAAALAVAPAWTQAQPLSAASVAAEDPQVASASDGRALVVWEQDGAHGSRVVTASREVDGTWSAPRPISPLGARPVSNPQVSMNARGLAVVTWQRSGRIFAAVRTAAGRWLPQQRVSPAGGPAAFPQVAVTARGRAYLVWEQRHGVHYRVLVVRRAVGGAWSQPTVLPSGFGDADRAQVAVDAHGHATVVWQRMWGDGGRSAVLMARRADHRWGATRVLSAPGQNADVPSVAMNVSGTTVVAWTGWDRHGKVAVLARIRPAAGAWHPIRVAAQGSLGDLGIGRSGTVFVTSTRTVGPDVRAALTPRPAGGPWGSERLLSPGGRDATVPIVAVGSRTVTVAWLSGVVQAVRRVDGIWGQVTDLGGANSDAAQLSTSAAGDSVVVWRQFNGTTERVMVSSIAG